MWESRVRRCPPATSDPTSPCSCAPSTRWRASWPRVRRGRRLPAAAGGDRRRARAGTSARCGCRPTPRARPALRAHLGRRLDAGRDVRPASRSVMLAPGQGMPGEVWQTGRPAWIADADQHPRPLPRARAADAAGTAVGLRVPDPRRRRCARGDGVLRRRRARTRRRAAGHDEEPGLADRPVRRALPCRARRARERCAQEAILNAAFDCIITMDGAGTSSRSTRPPSRPSATAPRRWSAASSPSS